jgi:hypothetical protein
MGSLVFARLAGRRSALMYVEPNAADNLFFFKVVVLIFCGIGLVFFGGLVEFAWDERRKAKKEKETHDHNQ